MQELPADVKEAQQKRLEELKLQSDSHARAELERKMVLRYRRVKFFGESTMCSCWIEFIIMLEHATVSDCGTVSVA